MVDVATQPLTRAKLAEFLGRNHELIKFFENLQRDVGRTLPDAIDGNTEAITNAAESADTALASANAARALAIFVSDIVTALVEGPPQAQLLDDLDSRVSELLPPPRTVADLGLGNVENVALSTWPGSTSITTLGTISTGIWQGSTIGAGFGGTGINSYSVGDMLYASGATALSKLASVASGNVLRAGGVGSAPAWGKVALTTDVSGILPVANGGTGVSSLSSLTANPSASVGLTVQNGSASTFMRSDAAPALDQAIAPTWTALHIHTRANATGVRLLSGAAGSYTDLALGRTAEELYVAIAAAPNNFVTGSAAGDFVLANTNGSNAILMGIGGSIYGRFDTNGLTLSTATLLRTSVSLTNGAAAGAGTLTNAPAAGNPTKWVPIVDNGTTRYIPTW